jgi:hypothetical protein
MELVIRYGFDPPISRPTPTAYTSIPRDRRRDLAELYEAISAVYKDDALPSTGSRGVFAASSRGRISS